MLPEGWLQVRLDVMCELINGRGFKPHEWGESGLPIIRIQNLNGGTEFNYYSGDYDPKIEVERGQLLFAWSGSRGTSFGPHVWNGPKAVLNYHTWKVVPRRNISKIFLHQNLRFITAKIESTAHGASALVHTQKGEMEKHLVFLPPLHEQRKIAAILSTWDAAIGAQEQLIANAKRQKKALMQTLLPTGAHPPKKRLPGFSGAWVRKHFRDAVYVDRNSLGQNTPADFRFRYISLSDVETGTIASELPELEFASAPSRARRRLNAGDILMATVRPNLQAFARVGSNHAECIASTGFAVLTAKPGFDPGYIYHYLFSEHLTGQIDALVVGSSYPAINSSDIQGLSMHCSGEDEQAAIAQVLNASDALITDHENQLSVFHQEKSALMQQLLTGKRRVKAVEVAA